MNYKYNNPRNDNPRTRSKPGKSNVGLQDSDASAASANSTSPLPEIRHCVFNRDSAGYGFKITGNAPVKVQAVRHMGSAWNAGLRENDVILKVNGDSVINKQHSDVVGLIRKQTLVELDVQSGDKVSNANISHIPTKIHQTSAFQAARSQFNKTPKSELNINMSVSKRVSDIQSSSENSNQPSYSKSSSNDQRRTSYESCSSSDCSISTSSTETDYNSSRKYRKISITPQSVFETHSLPKKPQLNKPQLYPKPNSHELNFMSNKISNDRFKSISPQDKDLPTKSHSYSASSNMSSKPFANSKNGDSTRNKTIPSDGVKSNNMHGVNSDTEFIEPQISFTVQKPFFPNKASLGIQKSKSISNNVLILGREFDNENRNDDDSDVSLSIIDLLSCTKDAISRPGLVSILIQYVNDQPNDLNIMMLYYACKFYKSFEQKKDFQTDAPRLANEIFTTFLFEKSPLYVTVEYDIVENISKNLKSSQNCNEIFNALIVVLFNRLENIVENVKGRIQRGMLLQADLPTLGNEENREVEMSLLHRTLCNIFIKNPKETDSSDFVIAKQIGLATIYQYFCKPSSLQNSNLRSRSTDAINTLGNQGKLTSIADLYKVTLFCSAYQQKLFSSIRKKPKSISGHSVVDAVCQQPEECAVCEGILWGPSPQGLLCTLCQSYFHMNCKKKIKNSCSRKSRKSILVSGNKEAPEKVPTTFLGRLSRKSSTSSVKNINIQSPVEMNNNIKSININNNTPSIQDEKSRKYRLLYRRRNTTIVSSFDQGTLNLGENIGVLKAKSEDQLHRIASNVDRFGSVHDVSSIHFNHSIDNTVGGSFFSDSVQIQELVQDESIDDPDMKVEESFDAGSEIQAVFPNIDPETDRKRLIVLLEFYHKARYILMNLKRFLYKLVLKWPESQFVYFKALSLDCIQPFVVLIKSFVSTIENCITEQGFINLEKSVYEWLSEDNDKRLKEWISLSSNLCCTNSLNIVKQLRQTHMRAVPELINLLNVKLHKMVIIEELTQIRPLLISLPLIVKNIIKCFSKSESLHPEQLAVWKDVSVKMDYLCEYIDRCCVPLVDLINNGSINKRSDRNDWPLRFKDNENISMDIVSYCVDFPRTLFHFPIFDSQMAKIFSWSRSRKKFGMDYPINYLKKGTEVLLLFYKLYIVVLQKENEHFYLKPIKPFKSITERLFPVIETSGYIATNGGQEEEFFILNIINKNAEDASLVRVGFTRKEFVDNWLDYFSHDNHSLSRSISLYRLNDIKEISRSNAQLEPNNSFGARLKSSESVLSNSSNNAPPAQPVPIPIVSLNEDTSVVEKDVLDIEVNEKEKSSSAIELSVELSKAVSILADQKKTLSRYLNIPDGQYDNALELITKQGPKTLQDMTLLLYSITVPLIDHIQQLVLVSSQESKSPQNFDKDDINKTLNGLSNIYRHIDSMENSGEIIQKSIGNKNETVPKRKLINSPLSLSRIELVSDLSQLGQINNMTPNEIIEDIKNIIDSIIDKSVNQVTKPPYASVTQNSYKYVPEKCLISTARETVERSLTLTPTYRIPNNQVDDTITTTRAQIILQRNSNNSV